MSGACLLSPPLGAGRIALEMHLQELRAMNVEDVLVEIAIEDAAALLKDLSGS
jgi:hypothetical protein